MATGSIAGGVAYTLGARMVSSVASLASQVLIARWLGPEGNGLLASALSVLSVGMLVADLGINTSVSRLLALAYYKDPQRIVRVLRTGAWLKAVLTVVVGALLVGGAGTIGAFLNASPMLVPVLVMAGIQLVFDNAATFSFRALQGLHRVRELAIGQTLSGVCSPILALTCVAVVLGYLPIPGGLWLAAALGGGLGVAAAAAVLGRAMGASLAALWAGYALVAKPVVSVEASTDTEESTQTLEAPARAIVHYASRVVWIHVAYLIVFRLDMALVQIFLGETQLGCYALPAQIGEKLLLPVVAMATVVAPYFAVLSDVRTHARLRQVLSEALRVVHVFYLPAALGLALVAPQAVRVVFGAAFDPAVPLVRLYAVCLPVLALATLLGVVLDYGGLARRRAIAFMGAAAVDITLNTMWIPLWGAGGAFLALLVSFTPLLVAYVIQLGRQIDLPWWAIARDGLRAVVASSVMALAVWAVLPSAEHVGSLWRLLLSLAVGMASYSLVLWVVGGVRRADVDRVRRWLRR